jgi:hypothetical protein
MPHQDIVDKISDKMVEIEIALSQVDKEEPTEMQDKFEKLLKQNEYNGYLSACTDIVKMIISDFERSEKSWPGKGEMVINFSKKCEILTELWDGTEFWSVLSDPKKRSEYNQERNYGASVYKLDKKFGDFLQFNDLGLSIAYAINQKIVNSSPNAEKYVNETFYLLCTALGGIDPEEDYASLEDMFSAIEGLEIQ